MEWILLMHVMFGSQQVTIEVAYPTEAICEAVHVTLRDNPIITSFDYVNGACVFRGEAA